MAVSPVNSETDLTTFSILVDGSTIDDAYEVLSIRTTKSINRISYASIILSDGSAASQEFEVSNKPDFLPGVEIQIKAGYHSKDETIFKGVITKHGISTGTGVSQLKLECRDVAIRITSGRKNGCFVDKTDSDIISALIGHYGLKSDVDSIKYRHKNMIQFNASDWDFLLSRAELNGLVVKVSDGEISVKKPDTSKAPVLVVSYGTTMLEFSAEMDSIDQVNSIKGYSWDSDNQKVVSGAERTNIKNAGNITSDELADAIGKTECSMQSNGSIDVNELNSWAAAKGIRSKLAFLQGNVKFQGSDLALPGDMLQLEGVGDRFNGNVFISAVNHTIEDGQWTTEVGFGLSPEWQIEEKPNVSALPASGLLPAVSGLQIGVVKQIHNDPDGNFRVLTKIPLLRQDQDAVWARLGTYYASSGFGSFFYPEVNDEVILGFINDDPRFAVILGSVYSKKNKPALSPEEKNEKKALITKSKLEVSFHDKDKVILIKTPGGNQITISDKDEGIVLSDQNKNSVTLDSSGITLDSESDISIRAKGNVIIEAGGNLDQTAKNNVMVEGLQIQNMAKTSFTAKGNASAELSASGQTTVKGAIVKIN